MTYCARTSQQFFPPVWNNETAILCGNFFQKKKQMYFEQKKNFRHFSNSCLTKLCCIFCCGAALVDNLLGYNYSVCQSKLRYYIIFTKKYIGSNLSEKITSQSLDLFCTTWLVFWKKSLLMMPSFSSANYDKCHNYTLQSMPQHHWLDFRKHLWVLGKGRSLILYKKFGIASISNLIFFDDFSS